MIKITKLTGLNVRALREMLAAEIERGVVEVNVTTAVFHLSGADAVALVTDARERAGQDHGTRAHPYQSLHAAVAKVAREAASQEGV